MRGEDEDPHWSGLGDRNTPTCVGKTRTRPIWRCVREKHPHVRGEDVIPAGRVSRDMETPPRAWGRRYNERPRARLGRNTPTCVGKTRENLLREVPTRKHPHVRGEDKYQACQVPHETETPPRAWGRRKSTCTDMQMYGNTPTCVGKTKRFPMPPQRGRKHPHVRGEDWFKLTLQDEEAETPPRAWGRQAGASLTK